MRWMENMMNPPPNSTGGGRIGGDGGEVKIERKWKKLWVEYEKYQAHPKEGATQARVE